MSTPATQARSLYRRILRELPARTPSLLANPSPMQKHIRADFTPPTSPDSPATQSLQHQSAKPISRRLEEAEQYIKYLSGQRMYTTLVERYNPGMDMTDEERVRLSARRVGMNMPLDARKGDGGRGGEGL